jgi:hypothetical protein
MPGSDIYVHQNHTYSVAKSTSILKKATGFMEGLNLLKGEIEYVYPFGAYVRISI